MYIWNLWCHPDKFLPTSMRNKSLLFKPKKIIQSRHWDTNQQFFVIKNSVYEKEPFYCVSTSHSILSIAIQSQGEQMSSTTIVSVYIIFMVIWEKDLHLVISLSFFVLSYYYREKFLNMFPY